MSNVIYNNFTAGLVTPKLAGNYNTNAYKCGCYKLDNFQVMLQGGITRRPPVDTIATFTGIRIIPFILSSSVSYILELGVTSGQGWYKLWKNGIGGWQATYTGNTVFSTSNIPNIQYCQSYDTLYLTHRDFTPYKLYFTGNTPTLSAIVPVLQTGITDEGGTVHGADTENTGMITSQNDHPSCCAYLYNRLWLASSTLHPNRLWASRPFEPENFEMWDVEKTVDDSSAGDTLLEWFEENQDKFNDPDETVSEFTLEQGYSYTNVYREDNAMRLDTDQSNAILWMQAKDNLLIGTATAEYAIPGSVNAQNQNLVTLSAYGSKSGIQAVLANDEILFIQSNGKRLRSLTYSSSSGYSCLDLTYQCDRILAEGNGVKRMAWKRVPEPTLYCVLNDGTVAVLFYNRGYSLCAWAHWTFPKDSTTNATVTDICVLDTDNGQDVFFLVTRGNAISLEQLRELDAADSINVVYKDVGNVSFVSEMKTNAYEVNSSSYGSTLGKKKRITSITCRVYQTKGFSAGYEELKDYSGTTLLSDREILLPGGYRDFVQMTVKSKGNDPLTLLAFSADTEVER